MATTASSVEQKQSRIDRNALVEIQTGVGSEGDLPKAFLNLAALHRNMDEVQSDSLNVLGERNLSITEILKHKKTSVYGVNRRVGVMLGNRNVEVSIPPKEFETVQNFIDLVRSEMNRLAVAFVENPFMIESIEILKSILLEHPNDNRMPMWIRSLEVFKDVQTVIRTNFTVTSMSIARIEKKQDRCVSAYGKSADVGMTFAGETTTGEQIYANVSTDGVTVPGIKDSDLIARDVNLQLLKQQVCQQRLLQVENVADMLTYLYEYNEDFIAEVSKRKPKNCDVNPHSTAAFSVLRKLTNGRIQSISAVIGDARSTTIWLDSKKQIHIRTLTSPINKYFDEISRGYGMAIAKGVARVAEILSAWYKNSYFDKYNAGPGSVAILGESTLFSSKEKAAFEKNEQVAVDEFEIPADAIFVMNFTNTDGLDLYAKLLNIPTWVAQLAFILDESRSEGNHPDVFGCLPEKFQVLPLLSPVGIAGMQAAHMMHNLDTAKIGIEPRSKIDEAQSSVVWLGDIWIAYETLIKSYEKLIPKIKPASYWNELKRCSEICIDIVGAFYGRTEKVIPFSDFRPPLRTKIPRHRH